METPLQPFGAVHNAGGHLLPCLTSVAASPRHPTEGAGSVRQLALTQSVEHSSKSLRFLLAGCQM